MKYKKAKVALQQIIGMIIIIAGGYVGVFVKQPAIGAIIVAIGFWVASLVFRK